MSALSKFEDPSQLTSLIPLGPVFGATVDKAYEYFTYGRFSLKPRMLDGLPHEIVFEIPAPALDEAEIKMCVDASNRFILIGENPAEGRLYKMSVKLPHDANFEKATFVAKLDRGLVRVTVTNFERKSVEVHFTK
ncbi:uncharacterized protein LOC110906183 [Helianthus annuus]|uniref:uncharacterized protein LOC110906183 n=1 Tax=Helianthus annuus TaxID=4232 RepID=UPI000B900F17|nr:uncharacterized protein LOC110906183 [Helianthus annuus]